MKTCSQCQQTLSLACFDIQQTGKLGRRADCKECRKRFNRSKRGLVKDAHFAQVAKSRQRNYTPPTYSETELYEWAEAQPVFHTLYEAWRMTNYASALKPSFDRLHDYISYRLDNLQIITWAENQQKCYSNKIDGTNNKTSHAVDMLDLNGAFIRRFHSVSEAARYFDGIPSNITGAANQRVSSKRNPDGSIRTFIKTLAYGHKWRYSSLPNNNLEIKP